MDKNNKVKARSFVPRSRFDNYYIVESGLKSGETIVYEGIQGLKDGARISPKAVSIDSLGAASEKVALSAR